WNGLFESTKPAVLYVAAVPASFGKGKEFGMRPSWSSVPETPTTSTSADASGSAAQATLALTTAAATSSSENRGRWKSGFDLRSNMARLLPLRRCRETTLISDELLSFQGLALEKHRGFFRALLF